MSKKTSIVLIPDEVIINKIFYIRGQKVMLDSDLAELYQVETKRLIEQVKRNFERFPHQYMFELTQKEFDILRSQFATSKQKTHPFKEMIGKIPPYDCVWAERQVFLRK